MLIVRGGHGTASMSSIEWIGASHVMRAACGSRIGLVSSVTRGSSIQASGKRLDDAPVELRVRRLVDDGALVLALEIDRVDRPGRGQLGDELVRPVAGRVELEAERRVEVEPALDLVGRRRIDQAPRGHEGDGARLALDGIGERAARLAQREVERGALERPATVVVPGRHLRRAREQRQRVEELRERVDRERPLEREIRRRRVVLGACRSRPPRCPPLLRPEGGRASSPA